MRRQDLIDNIEGSRLKKQFLEAFLLQSSFIEGLLKKLLSNDLFNNISFPIMRQINNVDSKHTKYLTRKIMHLNLFETINYLHEVEVINTSLKNELHLYRESRNTVLHDLVGKMSKTEFESEIEQMVTSGQKILENEVMISASESVQRDQEIDDLLNGGDDEKIREYFSNIGL